MLLNYLLAGHAFECYSTGESMTGRILAAPGTINFAAGLLSVALTLRGGFELWLERSQKIEGLEDHEHLKIAKINFDKKKLTVFFYIFTICSFPK